jgi:hypothetical protein
MGRKRRSLTGFRLAFSLASNVGLPSQAQVTAETSKPSRSQCTVTHCLRLRIAVDPRLPYIAVPPVQIRPPPLTNPHPIGASRLTLLPARWQTNSAAPPRSRIIAAQAQTRRASSACGLRSWASPSKPMHPQASAASSTWTRTAPPLAEGSLEECETRLLELLKTRHGSGKLNFPISTFGGKQFWGDVFLQRGWRNPGKRPDRPLPPARSRPTSGAPGARTRGAASPSKKRACAKESGRAATEWSCCCTGSDGRKTPSAACGGRSKTMGTKLPISIIRARAARCANTPRPSRPCSAAWKELTPSPFVTHSLGGIVVRDLLSLERPWQESVKLERVIMLAPPSRGSAIAEELKDWLPYRIATGDVAAGAHAGGRGATAAAAVRVRHHRRNSRVGAEAEPLARWRQRRQS